jgi:hypothetical protein
LKTEYVAYLKELGSTGAGLDPSAVAMGSPIANIICKYFHSGYWCAAD